MCVRACVCVWGGGACVCVCVRETDRGREGARDGGTEERREGGWEGGKLCVACVRVSVTCVYAYVRACRTCVCDMLGVFKLLIYTI